MGEMMDETHIENLKQLKKLATDEMSAKYIKGVEEHGGHLWRKGQKFLIDQAYSEAIDQVVYLGQLKQIIDGIEDESV